MKNQQQIIDNTIEFVKDHFKNDATGHDWWHVNRVWNTSLKLAREENADLFVVQLSALLHDLDDWKLKSSVDQQGTPLANDWLISQGIETENRLHICSIIQDLSFKGAQVETPMRSIEGKIVQDADRLDAMGAIGIARTFAYGGSKGRKMFDPQRLPMLHDSFHEYKNNDGPTINHFYEKLLLLKERMNTKTAIRLAKKRHKLMETFLENFFLEWDGND